MFGQSQTGLSQTGPYDSAAGRQRLRWRMKSMCVRAGRAWRLCTVRPVHPAEGMWMHTQALLPLPLGHHFVDNEISVPSESVQGNTEQSHRRCLFSFE